MTTITIEVDHPRKYRNKNEYRTQPRATWVEGGLSVQGDGYVIRRLCEDILASGADRNATVRVLGSNKPLFLPMSLEMWADPPNRQPEQLKRGKSQEGAA